MTDEELKAIEERANAATPGPWRGFDTGVLSGPRWVVGNEESRQFYNLADGRFIAHAREDVPALIAEVRRLRAENERLTLDRKTDAGFVYEARVHVKHLRNRLEQQERDAEMSERRAFGAGWRAHDDLNVNIWHSEDRDNAFADWKRKEAGDE